MVLGPRTIFVGVGLLVFSVLGMISSVATGTLLGVLVVVAVALLGLWTLTDLRKRVTVTTTELVVQGRLTHVRVDLADITAVHHQKTGHRVDRHRLVVWVAARGQRPFRICFLVGHRTFVSDLRKCAVACGARVDLHAPDLEVPPPDTRRFFTLL